jgi:hypothetical protein
MLALSLGYEGNAIRRNSCTLSADGQCLNLIVPLNPDGASGGPSPVSHPAQHRTRTAARVAAYRA